jgi:DNA (cytosine-5)-methyltransferase 1
VILNVLKNELEYKVFYKILNSKDFGVPQKRARIFIIGFRKDVEITNFTIINNFKKTIKIKNILEKNVDVKYYLSQKGVDGFDKHKARHDLLQDNLGYRLNNIEGESYTILSQRYGRKHNLIIDKNLDENERILYNKNTKFIRRFTSRELARLQGFPEDFIIPVSYERAYQQFGNSVTVPVVRAIAESIIDTIK